MKTRITSTREALDTLHHVEASLMEALENASLDVDEAIDLGCLLSHTVNRALAALEPLKAMLREAAIAQGGGTPGTTTLLSPDGTKCLVVIPQPTLTVMKDADMEKVKAALGDLFRDYFTETLVYSPRKDFRKTATARPKESSLAMSVVDFIEGTPRVSFRS